VRGDLAQRFDVVKGTRTKPDTSGSNLRLHLAIAVADSVASVRPWKALSITNDAGLSTPLAVAVQARSLIAASFASQAGVAEEAFSMPLIAASFSARFSCSRCGRGWRRDQGASFAPRSPASVSGGRTERVDCDSRERIEVFLPGFVPHPPTRASPRVKG